MSTPRAVSRVLVRRNLLFLAGLVMVAALTVGSSLATDFSFPAGIASIPKAFRWMAVNFIPSARAIKALPNIVVKLGETILVSIMATVLAGGAALVLAIFAARTTRPHPAVSAIVRLFASVCRNIPVVAWAMIFLLSFGQNVLTGLLSLFIGTVGYLTRAYAEAIDETAESSVEALHASGASWLQTVAQAVFPSVLPQITSWMLYMLETNIRDATLVGILTGTGIGFLFDIYYKSMNYSAAALVVIGVIIVVIAIESTSNALRKIIL
ncbi:MAG TPA: phosphonate ABC transporter, permease protein PhnE [Spirochaetia bacterium]|nr:phosphonate ABC transporter, permease protein PhnE [Spirochaetia bacterium]